jgi:hypothetical protein
MCGVLLVASALLGACAQYKDIASESAVSNVGTGGNSPPQSDNPDPNFTAHPPILERQSEVPISDQPELRAKCEPILTFPGTEIGRLRFTHSEIWGDILRANLIRRDDPRFVTRAVCDNSRAISVAIIPAGPEELLPRKMQGIWAEDGDCANVEKRALVTETGVRIGNKPFEELRYFPQGNLSAGDELWGDGTWSPISYDANQDVLLGVGRGSMKTFRRCRNEDQ